MHQSSYAKMESFFRAYGGEFPEHLGKTRVLEVGSKAYEGQPTYRRLIDESCQHYTGLDLEPGLNVDIVAKSGFVWPEIDDCSFDVCISGQTFEHNPYFWVTMAEISRCLAPGGYACIIAPGAGVVHRYPLDCWRFYPDSWAPLCALVGLEPLEVYFETDAMALSVVDGHMRDSMVIARKPGTHDVATNDRLTAITAPFRESNFAFHPIRVGEGRCVADYRKSAPRAAKWRARIALQINADGPARIYDGKD